jgi:adenylate cyclase
VGRTRGERRKVAALLAVATLAAGVGLLAYASHLLQGSELQTINARFSVRGTQPAPTDIVLVEIDNATFQELTRLHLHSEFPFPRRYDARVVDRLRLAGARTIAMDMEFSHPTDERDDLALFEAIGRAHGKTVLAATEVGPGGNTEVLGGPERLHEVGARAAEARLTVDSDGAVRRFSYSYSGLHNFAVVTAERADRRPIPASRFEGGTLPIDYVGPPGRIRSIAYSRVLLGRFPPGLFRGKIVVVGAAAPILQDVHTTATSGSSEMPGPEIWANAINTLLRGVPLRNAPGWVDVALIALLGLVVPLGSLRVRPRRSLLSALVLAMIFTIAIQIAFGRGLIVSFVYPQLALALGTLGTLAVLYMTAAIERMRVRDAFSRFVPEAVVDDVLARTDENHRLGGVRRVGTVLFSDLRGFTSFSEPLQPDQVVDCLNHYMTEMSEAIMDHGGTLVTYMGDGIMAVFGAPIEQPDHADRALAATREMLFERLPSFNQWMREQGLGEGFQMGIGLNSGEIMSGQVGSERRMEYTVIGDTVNTAARLEGMTKGTPHSVFVAESTRVLLLDGEDELAFVDEMAVRGREAAIRVWTIAPDTDRGGAQSA